MDSIKIIITRDVNPDGTGGTVVDSAAAILGSVGETKILDALTAAMDDAYGRHAIPDENGDMQEVSEYRNVSYRMREFATQIVTAYIQKVAAQQAREQAGQQSAAAIAAVEIVED